MRHSKAARRAGRADRSFWGQPATWALIGGGALLALGLRRRSTAGAAMAIAGLALGAWGVREHLGQRGFQRELSAARDRSLQGAHREARHTRDRVEQASDESFPASDAPAYTAVRA